MIDWHSFKRNEITNSLESFGSYARQLYTDLFDCYYLTATQLYNLLHCQGIILCIWLYYLTASSSQSLTGQWTVFQRGSWSAASFSRSHSGYCGRWWKSKEEEEKEKEKEICRDRREGATEWIIQTNWKAYSSWSWKHAENNFSKIILFHFYAH